MPTQGSHVDVGSVLNPSGLGRVLQHVFPGVQPTTPQRFWGDANLRQSCIRVFALGLQDVCQALLRCAL